MGEYVPEMTRNAYDQVISDLESSVASRSSSGKHSKNESSDISSEDSEEREKSHRKKRHGRARELKKQIFSPSSMLRELIKLQNLQKKHS